MVYLKECNNNATNSFTSRTTLSQRQQEWFASMNITKLTIWQDLMSNDNAIIFTCTLYLHNFNVEDKIGI